MFLRYCKHVSTMFKLQLTFSTRFKCNYPRDKTVSKCVTMMQKITIPYNETGLHVLNGFEYIIMASYFGGMSNGSVE